MRLLEVEGEGMNYLQVNAKPLIYAFFLIAISTGIYHTTETYKHGLPDTGENQMAIGDATKHGPQDILRNISVLPATGGGCIKCNRRTRYGWLCDPCLGDEIEATELNAHFAGVQFEWGGGQ